MLPTTLAFGVELLKEIWLFLISVAFFFTFLWSSFYPVHFFSWLTLHPSLRLGLNAETLCPPEIDVKNKDAGLTLCFFYHFV
jgi:hypothetical protein